MAAASALGLEPITFRSINDTQVDPEHRKRPIAQRQSIECMRVGAERFGWDKRNTQPGGMREGRWRIGVGVSAACRNNHW